MRQSPCIAHTRASVKDIRSSSRSSRTSRSSSNMRWLTWQPVHMLSMCVVLVLLMQHHTVLAEIMSASAGNVENYAQERCVTQKYRSMLNVIDDVEDLELDVPVHIALDNRQRKRFLLQLNYTTPLSITFSHNVARKIYYNQTRNLMRDTRMETREETQQLLLPCALAGQYDLFVQARQRGSVKIEAHAAHPQSNWPLLNRTHRVNIRSQNRVRKRQMIVKWERSKFDFYAMHYCLVVNTQQPLVNFCAAVQAVYTQQQRSAPCAQGPIMDGIWLRAAERGKKLEPPHGVNIVCTGSRTQQLLRGLLPNTTYYMDVFGVHTRRQNLTLHMASARIHFSRTHPAALRQHALSVVKISGLHGVQVFSYKVPAPKSSPALQLAQGGGGGGEQRFLRYLVIPCGGSELDVKILMQRRIVGKVTNVYRPTYIRLATVLTGQRYLLRFEPSNDDEKLHANKVGLAVTTDAVFQQLPELPENITVFEVRTRCKSTTIAWYSSPEQRTMSYCIIVFNLPQRNRSSIDYTNYCMDFGKRVLQHPQFYSIKCMEKQQHKSAPTLETDTIFNLTPGERYLIYVTANLSDGRPLPYQSLRVHMAKQCHAELYESKELTAYY